MFKMSSADKENQAPRKERVQLRAKGCKKCGSDRHTSMMCYQSERKRLVAKSAMNKVGKQTKAWLNARQKWVKNNPPNHQGYWKCYLNVSPNCLRWVDASTLNVDHIRSRVRDPAARLDQSNLGPSCGPCNQLKASRDVEELRP